MDRDSKRRRLGTDITNRRGAVACRPGLTARAGRGPPPDPAELLAAKETVTGLTATNENLRDDIDRLTDLLNQAETAGRKMKEELLALKAEKERQLEQERRDRAEDMDRAAKKLGEEVERAARQLGEEMDRAAKNLEQERKRRRHTKKELHSQIESLKAQNDSERNAMLIQIEELKSENVREVETVKAEKECELNTSMRSLEKMLNGLQDRLNNNEVTVSRVDGIVEEHGNTNGQQLECQVLQLTSRVEDLQACLKSRLDEVQTLQIRLATEQQKVAVLEDQARDHVLQRRKLHNRIQELRGNIRVYCRVRPPLVSEQNEDVGSFSFQENEAEGQGAVSVRTQRESVVPGKIESSLETFAFDRVFAPEVQQDAVFNDVSQLVSSALDGYAVCIFAYGQTGSGKTYTMIGDEDSIGNSYVTTSQGILPRTVKQIWEHTEGSGWRFSFFVKVCEIYNEKVYDLITERDRRDLVVDQKDRGVKCERKDDMLRVMNQAWKVRTSASTEWNVRSSRSHCITTITIEGNGPKGERTEGVINIVDLAGQTEIVDKEKRQQEAIEINKGLSALSMYIHSLKRRSNTDSCDSGRGHPLTMQLKPYMQAHSAKVLMFININPTTRCVRQSLETLRFGKKTNTTELGTARRMVS